jgi:hypothetical protein
VLKRLVQRRAPVRSLRAQQKHHGVSPSPSAAVPRSRLLAPAPRLTTIPMKQLRDCAWAAPAQPPPVALAQPARQGLHTQPTISNQPTVRIRQRTRLPTSQRQREREGERERERDYPSQAARRNH